MSATQIAQPKEANSLIQKPSRSRTLSARMAFYLQASITVAFLAGSIALTPLYPVYQAQWGFSPIAVTIVFGIYALAVLAALLVAGRLSDYIGRKPVLLAAIAVQVVTMFLFAAADGLSALLIARVLQGLSTGAAVAAVGAGLLDLDKARGTIANAIIPPLGTATGGIAAGLIVHFLPAPTHLVYLILAAVFILQGIGVTMMAETISPRAGALASLKPQISIPQSLRTPLLLAIPALVSSWALAGFYGALGPSLIRSIVSGESSPLLGGLTVFVLAGSAALSTFLLRNQPARTMMTFGAFTLLSGVALTGLALSYVSVPAFFLGTAVAGMGFGSGFQGAVRSVVPLAAPHERAGVLAVVFVVAYLAMGVPAVVAGFLLVHEGDIFTTARQFGAGEMILAVMALAGIVATRSPRSSAQPTPVCLINNADRCP